MRHGALFSFIFMTSCAPAPIHEAAAIERGRGITGATFQQLSVRLQAAMVSDWPAGVLQYCSVAATAANWHIPLITQDKHFRKLKGNWSCEM